MPEPRKRMGNSEEDEGCWSPSLLLLVAIDAVWEETGDTLKWRLYFPQGATSLKQEEAEENYVFSPLIFFLPTWCWKGFGWVEKWGRGIINVNKTVKNVCQQVPQAMTISYHSDLPTNSRVSIGTLNYDQCCLISRETESLTIGPFYDSLLIIALLRVCCVA